MRGAGGLPVPPGPERRIVALLLGLLTRAEAGAAHAAVAVPDGVTETTDALVRLAGEERAVVLGERHGDEASAALLLELMGRLYREQGYRYIALEAPEDWQVYVDQFDAGVISADALPGRKSMPDVARVVEEARHLSQASPERPPLRVLLVDGPSAWNMSTLEQTRDQRMFAHLRAVYDADPSARVLLFVGNTHVTEGVQIRDLAEGPGHRPDALPVETWLVAHYLDLWLAGRSLSVRTLYAEDPLGARLLAAHPQEKRLFVPVDGTPLATERGAMASAGSCCAVLEQAQLGDVTDFCVVLR